MLSSFVSRIRGLFGRGRLRQDIDDELAFHRAMLQDRLVADGAEPVEAGAAERRRFGGASRWRERMVEQWQFEGAENFARDVSFAVRMLRKSPAFTVVAVLTLAIGIGANTAIFSVVNGLLFRDLPVPHPEELVMLSQIAEDNKEPQLHFCMPLFRMLQRHPGSFSALYGFFGTQVQLRGSSGNEQVRAMLVGGDFFKGMQVVPQLGRPLTAGDDVPGGNPAGSAIVISDSFWSAWFNRAPEAIGRSLTLSGVPFTVVGVLPKSFMGPVPTARPQIYLPMSAEPVINAPYSMTAGGFHTWWLNVGGRLKPGVTMEQANAELRTTSHALVVDAQPDAGWLRDAEKNHMYFAAESGARGFSYLRNMFRKPLLAVFALCGVMLLLSCLNLASLLLARGTARQHELATRRALGASRGRLLQQLMTESLVLTALGCALGLLLSPVVSKLLLRVLFGRFQGTTLDISPDVSLILFACGMAFAATLLTGLLPAVSATRRDLAAQLKDGVHATADRARTRRVLPRVLMMLEVALALLLVSGAALLATSLLRLKNSGMGFDPQGLANISLDMSKQPLDGPPLTALYQQMSAAIAAIPGVQTVSFQAVVPLSHSSMSNTFPSTTGHDEMLDINRVAPEYFKAMRTPVMAGREFSWTDGPATGKKLILNQSAAAVLFPGRTAVGQSVANYGGKTHSEIIGVVGDSKYHDLREAPKPAAYYALTQADDKKPSYSLVVRYTGSSVAMAAAALAAITRLVPDIPAPVFSTMSADVDDSIATERMLAFLSLFFAGCALLVTGIGLYGTLSYATARRTSEIGIRMALGAGRGQVLRLVLRENVGVAMVGAAVGLGGALSAARVLSSFLYGTRERDPGLMLSSVMLLLVVSGVASLLPAVRASRIDPSVAIRAN